MILQALVNHYEDLLKKDKISPPGWSKQKVSYALSIDDNGEILQVIPMLREVVRGKKNVQVPQELSLPSPVKKRTSDVEANFLCDNSGYILGIDDKGKPERTSECHRACIELHQEILSDVDSPAARAVLAFFENWDPEKARENVELTDYLDDIISGKNLIKNLIFYYDDFFPLHEDRKIVEAWNGYYQSDDDVQKMTCLVTGKTEPIEIVHPSIKGIVGAKSSGAALVSFNAHAFESYGKKQGDNAPTGKYAAFAYTSALNYLISDTEHTLRIGDTTVLFWADKAESAYQGMFGDFFGGAFESEDDSEQKYSESGIFSKVKRLLAGESVEYDQTKLDPNTVFYVLGIAPNAARLSVRFFFKNTFGAFLQNVQNHYDRMEIVRPSYDPFETVPIWRMLRETVNMNSRDKSPAPNMAGAVLTSVLTDTRYPATLLNGITLRIRADHVISRERAATIKAYYLKNTHNEVPKEVLTVSLNLETDYVPYCLGRMFAVYEKIQKTVNPDLNSTIKDKYFTSASATPATIFPILDNLSNSHLKKLQRDNKGYAKTLKRQLLEITDKLHERYPARMTLPEQGSFQLGYYHQYYHQSNAFYTKKQEDTENG